VGPQDGGGVSLKESTTPTLISVLETALVMREQSTNEDLSAYIGLAAGSTEDEMWTSGMRAALELEDEDQDEGATSETGVDFDGSQPP